MKTPVAFFIFRRPDTTKQVFEAIRQAKPSKLLVVADGARPDRTGEAEKCAAARAIIEQVDWDCQVVKNYADVNLGCKCRVSSGISWIFEQVEEAIILEDDCLPHPTFFQFCEELLDYYRDDTRIMAIAGDNSRQLGEKRTAYSYYFSKLTPIWGWATWRRAWQYYDVTMKLWPLVKEGEWMRDILRRNDRAIKGWSNLFQSVYEGKVDTWDYQWTLAYWLQSGISIVSNVNLISNVGFNAEATHTTENSIRANAPIEAMNFPLQHPPFVICDSQLEELVWKQDFPGFLPRLRNKVRRILHIQ